MASILEKLNAIPKKCDDTTRKSKLESILKEASKQNHYQRMGISSEGSVDIATVKSNYKKLVLIIHPDKNNNKCYADVAEELFKLASEAYNTLTDSEKEKKYRLSLNSQEANISTFARGTTTYRSSTTPSFDTMFSDVFGMGGNGFSDPFFNGFPSDGFNGFPSDGFNGFPSDGFSGFASSTFRRSNNTNSSSQRVSIIDSYDKFMTLLDQSLITAHDLFRKHPDKVMAFFQSYQQYMMLLDKNTSLAHDFFRKQPRKIIGFFQTFEQFMVLVDKDIALPHNFIREQPDKIIDLIRTTDQFDSLKEKRFILASDILRKRPNLLSTLSSQPNQYLHRSSSSFVSPQPISPQSFFHQDTPKRKPKSDASSPSFFAMATGMALFGIGALTAILGVLLASSTMVITGAAISVVGTFCLSSKNTSSNDNYVHTATI